MEDEEEFLSIDGAGLELSQSKKIAIMIADYFLKVWSCWRSIDIDHDHDHTVDLVLSNN